MSATEFAADDIASNGNSALDWEIFDILCKDELGINVSKSHTHSVAFLEFLAEVEKSYKVKDNLDTFRICLISLGAICRFSGLSME